MIDAIVNEFEFHWYNNLSYARGISPLKYLTEFGTLDLSLPRACGKTHWVAHNTTSFDLVLVHSTYAKKSLQTMWADFGLTFDDMPRVIVGHSAQNVFIGQKGKHYDRLIVDEPGLIDNDDWTRFVETFFYHGRNTVNRIIKLGTKPTL